jgi:membrane associated rhomboid family serine protease
VSQPDLFVVCKNCGSEVSPYVTECPYCGQRVRKRAPKLDRSGQTVAPKRKRRARRLSRLRPDEIAGIAPDTRPYGTAALILVSVVASLIYQADNSLDIGYILMPVQDEVWRWFATPFLFKSLLGYQFVTMIAVAIFGTLIERRYGLLPVVLIFLLAGAAGSALAVTAETSPLFDDTPVYLILGANGAALGLLCAWLVEDRMAARRGDERDNDLLGVYVIGLVLLLLSLGVKEANIGVAVGGAVAGSLMGLLLPLLPRKTAY